MAEYKYIEREALMLGLQAYQEHLIDLYEGMDDGATKLCCLAEISGVAECTRIAENSPSADVVEVRRGQWEILLTAIIDTIGKCSNCGGEAVWRTRLKPYTLCPNCGAKMDGKGEG